MKATPRSCSPRFGAHLRAVLSVLLVACAPELSSPVRAAALRSFDAAPALAEPDVIDRRPTLTLRFDRRMATPSLDSVWLLDGPSDDSVLADARRARLSATNAARRIRAQVTPDPEDPRAIRVEPDEPLWPGATVTLVSTAALLADDGLVAAERAVDPAPISRTLRVCASPDCRTLAALATPSREQVPTALGAAAITFDRAIRPVIEGPVVTLVRALDREEVPGVGYLACPEGRAWRCVRFVPDVELAPDEPYRFELGALEDAAGRAVSPATLGFRTGSERVARRPEFVPTPACNPDELVRPPFCLLIRHGAVTLSARASVPAVLRARAGEWLAEGTLSDSPTVTLLDPVGGVHLPILASLVSLDGAVSREARLDPLVTPRRAPRLRITEVYARPRGGSSQEFVELLNDEPLEVSLEDFVLRTDAGQSALPTMRVAPGARVVVTGPTFDVRGDARAGDPGLSPGAVLVRLSVAIAQRGLSDRGGDVWLSDRAGVEVSRAPLSHPARVARIGVSVIRADATMSERDPASWMYDASSSATPGGPDRVR